MTVCLYWERTFVNVGVTVLVFHECVYQAFEIWCCSGLSPRLLIVFSCGCFVEAIWIVQSYMV